MGPFIYQSRKNGSVLYSFLGKNGLIVFLAALKKGAIRAAHPYHVIYKELPPEVTTNTDLVPFDTSECWYLTLFRPACEDLHVFQSVPIYIPVGVFKRPKTIDFRKILFSTGQWLLNDMICGFESRIGNSFYTSLNNNYMEG